MKILLVSPRNGRLNQHRFPLGLAYVSAVLKQTGHEVHCHNNSLEPDNRQAFISQLKTVQPEAIGIGGLTPAYNDIQQLIALTGATVPGTPVILGGGILSSEPDVFTTLGADIGLFGEGEETSIELFAALEQGENIAQVAGIMYRDTAGNVLRTPSRAPIKNLDAIPYPDYEGFNIQASLAAQSTIEIISSRGCPYNCTFCWSALGRGSFRTRSLDNLFGEIDMLRERYGITMLGVMDELFAIKPARVREFCRRIKTRKLTWYTQVRVDSIDAETLAMMKDAGCFYVFYGLESMDPTVLKSMNKKIVPQNTAKTLELTHHVKMNIFGNFIFGDPAETAESAKATFSWWLANRRYRINLGMIDCWPGTRIYHDALARGIIKDKIKFIRDGCPTINMTYESDEIFKQKILHYTRA